MVKLAVIDIETTGVDPELDQIVEIASVELLKSSEGVKLGRGRSDLVYTDKEIPPQASAVHHIIQSDLDQKPNLGEILPEHEAAAYIAHNANFERSFLDQHFGENIPWVCTFKSALRVWPDAPAHSNQVLRYWLGLVEPFGKPRDKIEPHRALSDVIITAAIFGELAKHCSWSQMLEWTEEPALHTTIRFGKHRGKRFEDIPTDYLDWVVDNAGMDQDIRFSAQYWLRKRDQKMVSA